MNTQAQTNSTNVNPSTIAAGLAQAFATGQANSKQTEILKATAESVCQVSISLDEACKVIGTPAEIVELDKAELLIEEIRVQIKNRREAIAGATKIENLFVKLAEAAVQGADEVVKVIDAFQMESKPAPSEPPKTDDKSADKAGPENASAAPADKKPAAPFDMIMKGDLTPSGRTDLSLGYYTRYGIKPKCEMAKKFEERHGRAPTKDDFEAPTPAQTEQMIKDNEATFQGIKRRKPRAKKA